MTNPLVGGRVPSGRWIVLARRAGALAIDGCVALFLGVAGALLGEAMELLHGARPFMPGAAVAAFLVLRTADLSLGYRVFGLSAANTSLVKNLIRAVAVLVPGYNVFDGVHALLVSNQQTFTDSRLAVKVVEARLR